MFLADRLGPTPYHRGVLSDRPLDVPSDRRLSRERPDREEILAGHRAALAAGVATYLDPTTGYSVFTAAHLLGVGACCDSGCRHCPYVD